MTLPMFSDEQHAMDAHIDHLIARGALFVCNHSGGKDSQSMLIYLRSRVPAAQLVIAHAVLPDVEWDGIEDHIRETSAGLPIFTCRSRRTLLEMIEARGMFPSPSLRQCTSDLKRSPLERTVRALINARIAQHPDRATAIAAGAALVVNCMGMRAQESSSRAKLQPLTFSERNSKAGREWYDWLPIHDWDISRVWSTIAAAGQKPHWAYAAGMSRLSCCFCIMSSKADLSTAARLNPSLYQKYVDLEHKTGQVMMMPSKRHGALTLEQITGIPALSPRPTTEAVPC